MNDQGLSIHDFIKRSVGGSDTPPRYSAAGLIVPCGTSYWSYHRVSPAGAQQVPATLCARLRIVEQMQGVQDRGGGSILKYVTDHRVSQRGRSRCPRPSLCETSYRGADARRPRPRRRECTLVHDRTPSVEGNAADAHDPLCETSYRGADARRPRPRGREHTEVCDRPPSVAGNAADAHDTKSKGLFRVLRVIIIHLLRILSVVHPQLADVGALKESGHDLRLV